MIQARETAVKEWLKHIVEVQGLKLPVAPEEVYNMLDSIDTEAALKEFTPNTGNLHDFINQNQIEALVFEWFYDGGDPSMGTFVDAGYGYSSCTFDGTPGGTDLLKIDGAEGFETDPTLEAPTNQAFPGFCLDPVTETLYSNVAVDFQDKHSEYYDLNVASGTEANLDEVMDAYSELFHLKLVTLLKQAYSQALKEKPITINTGKPVHVFIKRHDRWPLHIISFNI